MSGSKRADRIEFRKESEPAISVKLQLALHLLLLMTLQLYHLPLFSLLQPVPLLACSLDASPCVPAAVPH